PVERSHCRSRFRILRMTPMPQRDSWARASCGSLHPFERADARSIMQSGHGSVGARGLMTCRFALALVFSVSLFAIPAGATPFSYHTYSSMVTDLTSLANAHPTL